MVPYGVQVSQSKECVLQLATVGPGSSGGNAKACAKDPSKKACRGSKFKVLGFVVSAGWEDAPHAAWQQRVYGISHWSACALSEATRPHCVRGAFTNLVHPNSAAGLQVGEEPGGHRGVKGG